MYFFMMVSGFSLDIHRRAYYTSPVSQGYGVIGNTSVSGTAIRGSSPCSPIASLIAEKRSGLILGQSKFLWKEGFLRKRQEHSSKTRRR